LKNLYFSTKKQKWQNRDRFMSVMPVAEILPNGTENVRVVAFMGVYRNKSSMLPRQAMSIGVRSSALPLKILALPNPERLSSFLKLVTTIKPVFFLVMGN
jgi:hypothetical protein